MLELILTSLIAGCIISLFALAFWLTYKLEGYLNFSYIAVFSTAGYLSWLFYSYLGISSLLSLLLVVPASCVIGIILYIPTLWVKKSNKLLFSISALALVQGALILLFEKDRALPKPTEGLLIGNALLDSTALLAFLTLIIAAALLFVVIKKTRFGKAARAVLADESTAKIIGINPSFVRIVAAAAASSAAGMTGLLFALGTGKAGLSLLLGFKAMAIAAIAGFNLVLIPPLSFGVLLVENLAKAYLPMSQYYSQFIIFGILFLLLFVIKSKDL